MSTESFYIEHRSGFRKRIFLVIAIAILTGLTAELYGDIFYDGINETFDYYQGFRTGFLIGGLSSAIEVFYVWSVRRSWLRKVAFLPGLVARILVMTFIIRIGLISNSALTDILTGQPIDLVDGFGEEIRDTLFAAGIVVFLVTLSQLSSIIGFNRFINLVLGRYFRPVKEERIFMFVDLVGSSVTARRLGDVRFHEYLSEFFYQLDAAIVNSGGEIVSYVGDSVIVTWPLLMDGKRNARCLTAIAGMSHRLDMLQPMFEREFGEAPKFRIALHGGSVVVGECGNSRRQVTFLGDVINMTARIEGVGKTQSESIVASNDIIQKLTIPNGVTTEPIGEFTLRGADTPYLLYRIAFT